MLNKKIIISLVLFFILIYSVTSLKTFEINEMESISLAPEVEDPDADKLNYTFTSPLDKNGEWQTTYGDAGEYPVTITVSDGENEVSEEVLIIVKRAEAIPQIEYFEPKESQVSIDEGYSIKFSIDASDQNNDELAFTWELDGDVVSNDKEFLFEAGYKDNGNYDIAVKITDGEFNIKKEWELEVRDVDLGLVLDSIEDITLTETETASLVLPDFEKYGLTYSISEPIGENNRWKTTYDDAGEYKVTISAEGKDFKENTEVIVTIENKDRPPKFVGLKNVKVYENNELKIILYAQDSDKEDKDNIFFSAQDMLEGSKLEDDVFTWTPGYGFVQKSSLLHYVADKFKILNKNVYVTFIAQSNELTESKKIKISVKDSNRPFVLEEIKDIEVNEGDTIILNPEYNDPDNDKVSFSYSGFMAGSKKTTSFDDAGSYVVKVTATDDFYTQDAFFSVKVNNVNRKPSLRPIGDFRVTEGNELKFKLNAQDPDNDALEYSVIGLPKGAKFKDNTFTWTPDLDTVFNETQKKHEIEFIISDSKQEEKQKIIVTVLNKNQAPKIVDFSDNSIAFKDKPILFEVNVIDKDADKLIYKWDFGFMDKVENDENQHQRTFTTTGKKEITLTVSDGKESVSKVWNVEVV